MNSSLLEKITVERSLIYILIVAVLIVFIFMFYLLISQLMKSVQVLAPNGGEEWEIGQTHQITWKARGIEKVGIVLFEGREASWIAKNVPAKPGKYDWKIYPGQEYGPGFWIAVFEYPWQKDNKIDYSNGTFAVVFSELFSCNDLSIEKEWLYLPSDFPNLRRVFITEDRFSGNLDGLEGADQKCQQEAEEQGFDGKWQAFLGGDSDEDLAVERLKRTPRKTDGVFIEAKPAATLIREATCHRLLGKNLDGFLEKFSDSLIINQEKLEEPFLEDMENLWLGRIDERSRKNCISIFSVLSSRYTALAEKYSFTATCQNWTKGDKLVAGYPVIGEEPGPSFPSCYTPEGKLTDAVALGGLSSALIEGTEGKIFISSQGKHCSTKQKLLCIEE